MATTDAALLTAEEYLLLPDNGLPTELIRGKIVTMPMSGARHGLVCNRIGRLVGNFVEEHDSGSVFNNDTGIVTRRTPDTVRGVDVAFYSYKRIPKGQIPQGYPALAPELAFEVRSPSDTWKEILVKIGEYLNAGVLTVCVVDPETESASLYYPEQPPETLSGEQESTFPTILPGFRLPVRKLFE